MNNRILDFGAAFEAAMPALGGAYDIYEVTAGRLSNDTGNFSITYPGLYITNLTSSYYLTAEELLSNITAQQTVAAAVFQNKEPFMGGVVAVVLVLCAIVTAAWMLFLLLLLSSNSIPNSLILCNLFFCGTYTAMLAKLTKVLEAQVADNLADTYIIQYLITYSTDMIILRSFASLFIWVSWIDLILHINKHHMKRLILTTGLLLALASFALGLAFSFLYWPTVAVTPRFLAVKVLHHITEYVILISFSLNILYYSWIKRIFAYHKRAMAMAIFSLLTLISPIVFTSLDLASASMQTWAIYMYTFSKLCVTVIIWEWLHTIRSLETRHEKKTVLGRRISNDSFAKSPDNESQTQNSYIFKSLNIVSIFAALKSHVKLLRKCALPKRQNEDAQRQVQLYDILPTSTRTSTLSQQSGVSIEAHHPQFEVDHRYLRATPSTANPTPVSHLTGT